MKKLATIALSALCVLGLASLGFAQQVPQLNEVVMNDVSIDDSEFVEICGEPNADLSAFTVIVIEGEGTGMGLIDRAFGLTGLIGASGFYTLGDAAVTCADQTKTSTIENGGETILLVRDFTGAVGQDIDADDDGVADGPFPGMIVDGVGFAKPSSGDATYYGVPTLGPDTGDDGMQDFDVAGAARCEDCTGGWGMICLAGTEGAAVCDTNSPFNPYNVTNATPCGANACPPISVESTSWGLIKGSYR